REISCEQCREARSARPGQARSRGAVADARSSDAHPGRLLLVSSRRAAARSTGLVVDDRRPRRTPAHDSIRRAHPLSKHRVGHECCGSPFAPFEPTRRVSNVIWGGGRLADILADCWLRTGARYIWSYGADFGEF